MNLETVPGDSQIYHAVSRFLILSSTGFTGKKRDS